MDHWELIIILIITLIFFGVNRLRDLPRRVAESMEEWKRQPEDQQLSPHYRRTLITIILGWVSFIALSILSEANVISAGQKLVVMAVVFVWLIAGFYCFGKRN